MQVSSRADAGGVAISNQTGGDCHVVPRYGSGLLAMTPFSKQFSIHNSLEDNGLERSTLSPAMGAGLTPSKDVRAPGLGS
jgi:hypothetical protein